jgi:hypothetical protein
VTVKIKKSVYETNENRYAVLNSREAELRISRCKKLYRVLIDREDLSVLRSYHWIFRNHPKLGMAVMMFSKTGSGQSLHSFLFDGKPRQVSKIPKDRHGRFDYRKRSLIRFARGNHFVKVNQDEVELRLYQQDDLVRILMDKEDMQKADQYYWFARREGDRIKIFHTKGGTLHNVILGERRTMIQDISRDRLKRLDYRKKSLLPLRENYVNTYRIINKTAMELTIKKKDKTYRIRFDREDHQRIKQHHWHIVKSAGNMDQCVFSAQSCVSLATVILNDESIKIESIPVGRMGWLDYRKKSLLSQVSSYSNEYRILNKKAVELTIVKKDLEFHVIFDREDYPRVKERHWRGMHTSGGIVIVSGSNGLALTRVIFKDKAIRIKKIPEDQDGRLDYRKESLRAAVATFSNTYRFINRNEVELQIAKNDLDFRIIFDRENYEQVKAHHWRGEYTAAGSAVIETGRTDLPLSRVIFKKKRVRINNISQDKEGRLDYRKKSMAI